MDLIYLFDLFTCIFAITGAVKEFCCRLISASSSLPPPSAPAGMLRDMLIGATRWPPSPTAGIIICVVTGLVVFFTAEVRRTLAGHLYADSLGLGVFTAIGVAMGAAVRHRAVGQLLCGVSPPLRRGGA